MMIRLTNIRKNIGQTQILRGINLHIQKGEFVAIIGQSGSGKTTLLNIIGTLDEPSSGSYVFANYEVTKLNSDEKSRLRREKIGFIFQRYNLLSLMSAKENVALPAVYAGVSSQKRDERAKELLANLELTDKFNSKPNELSGGQQQRVSIARALMNGGDLILADEPTGALDSKSGVMVLDILQRLNSQGHTIVLVTHDPTIAAKAGRIIEIKDGEIIKDSLNSNAHHFANSEESISNKENSKSSVDFSLSAKAQNDKNGENSAQNLNENSAQNLTQNLNSSVNLKQNSTQSLNLNENSQISSANSKNSMDYHASPKGLLAMTSGTNSAQKAQIPLTAMPQEIKTYHLLKNQIIECLKIAYSSILAHKLRSLLTMLGIIIGIASVVSVVALGLGSQKQILESISRLGTNTIEVRGGRGFGDIRSGKVKLALSDLYALKSLPQLESVEAQDGTSSIATYGNISLSAKMEGGGVSIFSIKGLNLGTGRFFNESEVSNADNVAVIDDNGRKRLFDGLLPEQIIGKTIICNKQPFKIIGILEKDSRRPDTDITVRIYTPYTTLRNKITGSRVVEQIIAKVRDDASPALAEEAMVRTLEIKRGKKDFFTINSDSIRQSIEENMATMTLLITCIAVIALVVGGIGVMNIMIVSVSERTREIGIRMAIGARKEDILFQFLIEAVMICMMGAVLGVGLCALIVFAFNSVSTDFLMIVSSGSVVLGLASSVLIGLIFGFFPAKNAANLNPINALSKE